MVCSIIVRYCKELFDIPHKKFENLCYWIKQSYLLIKNEKSTTKSKWEVNKGKICASKNEIKVRKTHKHFIIGSRYLDIWVGQGYLLLTPCEIA